MKYKTLFRMMLRFLGMWLFVLGTSQVLGHLVWILFQFRSGWGVGERFAVMLPQLLQIAAGCYLFFGGKWIADKAIPSNRPYCHECGYDLTNAAGNVCSECGTPFKPPEMSSAP